MTSIRQNVGACFRRDTDRALLAGVCAGLATHLGFNLKVTRFLAIVAFIMAAPIAIAVYLAAVFLIPAESGVGAVSSGGDTSDFAQDSVQPGWRGRRAKRRQTRRKAADAEQFRATQGSHAADLINNRCADLDKRLIRLEERITSRQFQLDQEISRL